MGNARRQVGEASMGGFGVREVPASDRAKIELLELGDAGFRVFRPRDLDWTHQPWLIAEDDGSVSSCSRCP
jgi:hypothetical protein